MKPFALVALFSTTALLGAAARGEVPQAAPRVPQPVETSYRIEIEGASIGPVASASGGEAFSDIALEKLGPDHVVRKHVAGLKYEDIRFGVGPGVSKAFWEWVRSVFLHTYQRHNGALYVTDPRVPTQAKTTWYNAVLKRIEFPSFDVTSQTPAMIGMTVVPEFTRHSEAPLPKMAAPVTAPRTISTSRFRFSLDGIDTSRVLRVSGLTLKVAGGEHTAEVRDYVKEPTHIVWSNLSVTFAGATAQSIRAWHNDFIIQGKNGPSNEKGGSLEYLDANGTLLFRVGLKHVGIHRLGPGTPAADGSSTIEVGLYVEEGSFEYTPAATAP